MSRIARAYPDDRVILREVGLRDGLQLVSEWPDTATKGEWIATEYRAGVRHFEIGSFLPASRFPQFADLGSLLDKTAAHADIHSAALALNERGAEDALQSNIDEIVCVISATEAHSEANVRRSRASAIELVRHVCQQRDLTAPDKVINVGISVAFGCTIAGEVFADEVLRLAWRACEAGADLVGFADTVGYAGPRQVGELCREFSRLHPNQPFLVHLHDTRGMGIANAAAALDNGARILDASLGGLGGCPFAPGATGNVVLEDMIFLCERMGFTTGIDMERLAGARAIAETAMPTEIFYGSVPRAGLPGNITWSS